MGRGDYATREEPVPEHQELTELLAAAQTAHQNYASALAGSAGLMGAGVWTGAETATAFAVEIEGKKSGLTREFDEFIIDIQEELAAVPATRTVEYEVWWT